MLNVRNRLTAPQTMADSSPARVMFPAPSRQPPSRFRVRAVMHVPPNPRAMASTVVQPDHGHDVAIQDA
jgi:hypothetical protein